MGELISLLSGKGGTGKTSLCAAIASALAQQGEKVLCIDCSVGFPNLDICLGISELAALSFLDFCRGGYGLDQATQHPLYNNLYFLTAPVESSADEIDAEAFKGMLEKAKEQFSFVLLDGPAGADTLFRLTAESADRVLVVTGFDPASVRSAAHVGEMLERMGKENVRIIINGISMKAMANLKLTVDDIMDQTGLPLMGIVPEDPNVFVAAASHKPLLAHTQKDAAAACKRIAVRLQGKPSPIPKKI